jgi:hypothetical protein
MNNKLVIKQEDLKEYQELIEECKNVIYIKSFSQAMDEIEKRHEIGRLIITSPLYKKYGKGTSSILERVGKDLQKGKSWIYESIKFYEKYPDLKEFISRFKPEKQVIRWADVRKELPSPNGCKHLNTETETIEITRVRCVDCGRVLDEQKIKI